MFCLSLSMNTRIIVVVVMYGGVCVCECKIII
jgi:hypothetical protein